MKLLGHTFKDGDEVAILIGYRERLFFQGDPPEDGRLLFFDLEGLDSNGVDGIRQWLAKVNKMVPDRRNIARFGREMWRYATPFDILEVENYSSYGYSLTNYFTFDELEPFFSEVLPKMQKKLTAIVETKEPIERIAAIDKQYEYFQRSSYPVYYLQYKLHAVKEELSQVEDRKVIARLKDGTFNLAKAIAACDEINTVTVRQILARYIAQELIDQHLPPEKFLAAVRKVGKKINLRDSVHWDPTFWGKISPYLELPSNVKGEIDITNASEQTVAASWDLVNGKRAGTVVIGRTALVVYDSNSAKNIFVRGDRKLQFKTKKAGRLKMGNFTLTIDDDGMGAILLDVERIDTICSLDPAAALKLIETKNLNSNHAVFSAAERALDDYKQARVLADLIIELTVGIDADVARNLARGQSRMRR